MILSACRFLSDSPHSTTISTSCTLELHEEESASYLIYRIRHVDGVLSPAQSDTTTRLAGMPSARRKCSKHPRSNHIDISAFRHVGLALVRLPVLLRKADSVCQAAATAAGNPSTAAQPRPPSSIDVSESLPRCSVQYLSPYVARE